MSETISHQDWKDRAVELFGPDSNDWAFQCPICSNVATVRQFIDLGLMGSTAAEECLGRHDDSIDCKHAAYGFIPGPGVVTVERDGEFLNAFPFQDPS